MGDTLFSIGDDNLFGLNSDTLELRLPTELKDAVRRKAAEHDMTVSNYLRLLMAMNVWGEQHVASLIAKKLRVVTTPVPARVGTAEPTA